MFHNIYTCCYWSQIVCSSKPVVLNIKVSVYTTLAGRCYLNKIWRRHDKCLTASWLSQSLLSLLIGKHFSCDKLKCMFICVKLGLQGVQFRRSCDENGWSRQINKWEQPITEGRCEASCLSVTQNPMLLCACQYKLLLTEGFLLVNDDPVKILWWRWLINHYVRLI